MVAECGGMAGGISEQPERFRRHHPHRGGQCRSGHGGKGPRPAGERHRRAAEQGAERQRRGHQPGGLFLPEGAGRGGAASRTGGGHPRRAGHPGGRGSRPRVERGHGASGPDGAAAGRTDRDRGRVRGFIRAAAPLVGPRPHPTDAGRRGAGQRGQDAAGCARSRFRAGAGRGRVPRGPQRGGAADPRRPRRPDGPADRPAGLL